MDDSVAADGTCRQPDEMTEAELADYFYAHRNDLASEIVEAGPPERPSTAAQRQPRISLEDIEQLKETIAILRDPETMARLAESDAELARGEVVSADDLAAAMRR